MPGRARAKGKTRATRKADRQQREEVLLLRQDRAHQERVQEAYSRSRHGRGASSRGSGESRGAASVGEPAGRDSPDDGQVPFGVADRLWGRCVIYGPPGQEQVFDATELYRQVMWSAMDMSELLGEVRRARSALRDRSRGPPDRRFQ